MLYDTIRDARPTTPIWSHRHTANHRRYYERLATMPAGLVVLGDSLCTFNPIYGQGMTVAALQATALADRCRRRIRTRADAVRFSRSAQRQMAAIAGQAWLVSASQDRRYQVTGGAGPADRALHGFMDRVMLASTVDPRVAQMFLRVLNMLDSPLNLQTPGHAHPYPAGRPPRPADGQRSPDAYAAACREAWTNQAWSGIA